MSVDASLAHALASIDAIRRRMFLTTVIGFVAAFGSLWRFGYVLRTSADPRAIAEAAVFALVVTILLATFLVVFFVARMTKRVLRAVYTAAASRPPQT